MGRLLDGTIVLWELFFTAITGLGVGSMLAKLNSLNHEYTPTKNIEASVMLLLLLVFL